jgi:hypothetical protein
MGYFAEGYVDEVRVSNGIARWPSNFTPPASEYTNKTTPTINWPTPAPITYGTALSATQLNATASANGTTVPGNFVYSPPATTLLPVGNNQTLNVTFTPTDTTDYATATGSARINVNQATTTTVENAASGTYGGTAALSATVTSGGFGVSGLSVSFFLNSSSTSVGSATTDSSGVATLTGVSLVGITAGTYPTAVGASFAGNTSYGSSSGTGSLSVGQATATVTLGSLTQTYTGSALTPANTTSPPSLAITWTGAPQTGAGSYSVTATVNDANYQGSASGTFTIAKATPAITWTNPADIAYGTALGSAQLNASAGSVAGTFAYTPASGTVLGVGSNQTLNVIFTPTDTTDFNSAAASVKINVTDSTVTVSGGAYNYPESSSYQASISFPVSVTGNPLGGSIQYIYAKDRYGFVSTGVTAVGGNSGSGVTISATGKLNGTTGYSMLLKVTTTAFEIYIYNPDGSLKFHGPNAPIAGGSITITP